MYSRFQYILAIRISSNIWPISSHSPWQILQSNTLLSKKKQIKRFYIQNAMNPFTCSFLVSEVALPFVIASQPQGKYTIYSRRWPSSHIFHDRVPCFLHPCRRLYHKMHLSSTTSSKWFLPCINTAYPHRQKHSFPSEQPPAQFKQTIHAHSYPTLTYPEKQSVRRMIICTDHG